jgi:two-component system, OmpR family, sensor kinase
MTRLSLRTRLTLWYSCALLAAMTLVGAAVLWQQSRIGMRRVDRELNAAIETLANMFREELSEIPDAAAAAAEAQQTLSLPGRATAILDADGRELSANWNGMRLPKQRAPSPDSRQSTTIETVNGSWRVYIVRMASDPAFTLVVGAPLSDVNRERREALEAMWIAMPIALVLACAGGLWLATLGLRPISDMAARASQLSAGGLDDLGQSNRRDELGTLARAFNDLVARLRGAVTTQQQFMADASHELRTPLSVIQSAADVALARPDRTAPEYRETLTIVAGEARRMGRLVEDMLVLARADAGGYRLQRVELYLDELVTECARSADVLARERNVTIQTRVPADVPFRGDEDLLRRMLLNVVRNAVQHARMNGEVRVVLSPNGATTTIRVHDDGPGIADRERERIFDRFVQLDDARRRGGAGLGLPIARWIAEAHGGALDLEASTLDGSTFRIVLPVDPGAGAAAP